MLDHAADGFGTDAGNRFVDFKRGSAGTMHIVREFWDNDWETEDKYEYLRVDDDGIDQKLPLDKVALYTNITPDDQAVFNYSDGTLGRVGEDGVEIDPTEYADNRSVDPRFDAAGNVYLLDDSYLANQMTVRVLTLRE